MRLDDVFRTAHLEIKPRTPLPQIQVEFFPFAGLNHTARFREGLLRVRVSDLLQDAPDPILESIARILLARLYRKKVDEGIHRTYRAFTLRADVQSLAREARISRGRRRTKPITQGHHADLDASFDRMNALYFDGLLQKPTLSWSARRSRRILGRYDSTHHAIFISRLFDSPRVPSFVLDYVMFHEMLHAKHKSRIEDLRMLVHTREFRADEKRFERFEEAKHWLRDELH